MARTDHSGAVAGNFYTWYTHYFIPEEKQDFFDDVGIGFTYKKGTC